MKRSFLVAIAVVTLCLAACGAEPTPVPTTVPPVATPDQGSSESPLATPPSESPLATPPSDAFESPVGLPNPASVFCEEQGYKLELRTDASGTTGYCIFPDGSECEEWAFFRGECAPGVPPP
jgi:putative hemolysin